jgi:hypothetical protein
MNHILASALLLMSFFTAKGQYDQEIISVGDRTLTVEKAFKIDELPSTIDSVPRTYEMDYQSIPRQVEVQYVPKQITAAKLKLQDPLTKLYKGYAKAGIGVYTTPLLDFRFNAIRNRDWDYGVQGRHFSSQGGVKDLAENAFSENHFGGWATKYISKHTLEVGLDYDRNTVHYYGFQPGEFEVDKKDYRQRFSTINGHAELQSHYSDSSMVQHKVGLNFRNMSDRFDGKESNILINADLAKTIDDYRFGLGFEVDANNFTMGEVNSLFVDTILDLPEPGDLTTKGGIIRLEPNIHARKKDLTADIGLGFAIETGEPESALHIYPRAYVSYSLFDDLFTPYAGLTGDLERNSYHSLSQVNPFIANFASLRNTGQDLRLFAGVRGTILDNLGFNAQASITDFDDRPLFVNDVVFSPENRFNVIYEDMREVNIKGELTYKHDERLTVVSSLSLSSYSLEREAEAWNLPGWEFQLDARYDLDDQFVVKAQIFAQGKRFGKGTKRLGTFGPLSPTDSEVQAIALSGFVDGSLAFEYRYTKRISAFLEVNNLTGGRYSRWYRFPVQPVMVLGGLTYSF